MSGIRLDEVGADRLDRQQVAEVVERHRLGHLPPGPEHRPPVDVAAREGAVGAGRDRPLRILGGERDRDHPAHRGAVAERPLDPELVEQPDRLVGPALDRVGLDRLVGSPVAARVVAQQAEPLAEAVVDGCEVLAAEQRAAELEDERPVLGARELVVDPRVVDGDEGHLMLLGGVMPGRNHGAAGSRAAILHASPRFGFGAGRRGVLA